MFASHPNLARTEVTETIIELDPAYYYHSMRKTFLKMNSQSTFISGYNVTNSKHRPIYQKISEH